MTTPAAMLDEIAAGLAIGRVIPYIGPGVLAHYGAAVPTSHEALATLISSRVSVPFKIRKRLTAAAQFVENFKHRKTLVDLMRQAFAAGAEPTPVHRGIAALPVLPLVVDTWYDDALRKAFAARPSWGEVQGLSQAEHFGNWVGWFDADGAPVDEARGSTWSTLLYKPTGGIRPAGNYLVSDSDFVEVLTEIDIQTPIPARIQELRRDRSFLFIGCRFDDQLQRTFARQIMKRSSALHWALLPAELSRNERRFIEEQGIVPLVGSPESALSILAQDAAVPA